MRRAIAACALGLLLTGAGQAPAGAHAELVSATPPDGSIQRKAPAVVVLRFGEPVEAEQAALLGAAAAPVAARVTGSGTSVRIAPERTLPKGRYAATWSVRSDDGHVVSGATAFAVGSPRQRASAPATIATVPAIRTTIEAGTDGIATVRFASAGSGGEVAWSHAGLLGPLRWPVTDGTARGMLPFAGTWQMRATLVTPTGAAILVTGSAVTR